ncbi:MAG: hypothetical protein JWN44_5393 [Myxococcales bacterium]|nr:hypothetical protein [Myxococcales bacterium]
MHYAGSSDGPTWWQPASCVKTSAELNVVTYTLDNCTGPSGLVHVTGSAVVTYSAAADGIHASGTASALQVNGTTMDLSAAANYPVTNGTKKLVVATNGSGVGPRGNSITRNGSYRLTWNDATGCGTLDGAWSTGINHATWATSISNYAQCIGHCPTSGRLAHTGGLSGVTVTVDFDGSSQARWTSSRGHSGTIGLFCIK